MFNKSILYSFFNQIKHKRWMPFNNAHTQANQIHMLSEWYFSPPYQLKKLLNFRLYWYKFCFFAILLNFLTDDIFAWLILLPVLIAQRNFADFYSKPQKKNETYCASPLRNVLVLGRSSKTLERLFQIIIGYMAWDTFGSPTYIV